MLKAGFSQFYSVCALLLHRLIPLSFNCNHWADVSETVEVRRPGLGHLADKPSQAASNTHAVSEAFSVLMRAESLERPFWTRHLQPLGTQRSWGLAGLDPEWLRGVKIYAPLLFQEAGLCSLSALAFSVRPFLIPGQNRLRLPYEAGCSVLSQL